MDAVGQLDLQSARVNERGTGDEQYPPGMMLGLLIYSYATGVFSSRQIERSTSENVAVRLLCADTHPDHDTVCAFRRQNGALLAQSFAQVLEMAARCGVLKVGGITVAIDGTKVLANASKHTAVSYQHAGEQMRELDLEIEELLHKAEEADSTPWKTGFPSPRRCSAARSARLCWPRRARRWRRAPTPVPRPSNPNMKQVRARREKQRQEGKKPRGRDPQPPDPTPGPKDQYNLTDPESRIMKAGSGEHYEQCLQCAGGGGGREPFDRRGARYQRPHRQAAASAQFQGGGSASWAGS